jgi:AraC-like DNA-binding protein
VKVTLVDSKCPALAPWLIGYLGGEIAANGSVERRLLPPRPNHFVQIILDGTLLIRDVRSGAHRAAPDAGLYGLLSHFRYELAVSGSMRSISVRLQPGAAGVLFGVDPVPVVDNHCPIELPDGLRAELQAAPNWGAMVEPLDRWLLTLAEGKRRDDPVALQAASLRQLNGNVSIQQLADAAGISLRHFQRRFRALTGLNPKHYARICRIGHAVHLKQLRPEDSWTTLAHEAGYSDQPHFIRDFKALTGVLPSDFLRGQSPILRYPRWEE